MDFGDLAAPTGAGGAILIALRFLYNSITSQLADVQSSVDTLTTEVRLQNGRVSKLEGKAELTEALLVKKVSDR